MKTIKELRELSKKTVLSPITELQYLIRKLSSDEFLQAQFLPIFTTQEPAPIEPQGTAQDAARAMKWEIDTRRQMIEAAVLSPRVFFGDEDKTPDGAVHPVWIGEDLKWLTGEILKFSGFDDEGRQRVEALIKNEQSSASSTQ